MIDQLEQSLAETRELSELLRRKLDKAETELLLLKSKLLEHGVIVK
jgi:hypothetical protein